MTTSNLQNYTTAGFNGVLEPGSRTALLVIDTVNAYVNPDCPLYAGVEDAASNIISIVAAARVKQVPVFFTRVDYSTTKSAAHVFARKVPALEWFGEGNINGQYIDGLEPLESDYEIVKLFPSAFAGTALASLLTAHSIDTVIITGFSTSGCVRATATDAMQAGLVPVVVSDAVGDRLPGPHEANLFDIEAKIGTVVSTEQAIGLLS